MRGDYMRADSTARLVALVTIDGDKWVGGTGIVYPDYYGDFLHGRIINSIISI